MWTISPRSKGTDLGVAAGFPFFASALERYRERERIQRELRPAGHARSFLKAREIIFLLRILFFLGPWDRSSKATK